MDIERKRKFIINYLFFSLIVVTVYFSLRFAFRYLLPFIIAILIAYFMQRPALFISRHINLKKDVCAAILAAVTFVLILSILTLLLWSFFSNSDKIVSQIPIFTKNIMRIFDVINSFSKRFINNFSEEMTNTINSMISNTINNVSLRLTSYISSSVAKIVKSMPSFLISCVFTVVASCYFSKEYDRLCKFIKNLIKESTYDRTLEIKGIFFECVLNYSLGYLLIMGITMVELLIGFFILGVKHFIILAIIVALIDLLPLLGTGTVLLPWAIFLFLENEYPRAIGMVVLYLLICILRNFLEPKIIGKQIGSSPLLTLITIFLGYTLAGFVGMIVLPIAVMIVITYYKRQLELERLGN